MKRLFVETEGFRADWKDLGQTDESLRSLQNHIAEQPSSGPMIQGVGGARKIRWSREGKSRGKSAGIRVIYLDDPRIETTYLLAVFGKEEQDNLSDSEKKVLKVFIKALLKE